MRQETRFKFTKAAIEALPYGKGGNDRPEYRDTELPGLVLRVGQTTKTYYLYHYAGRVDKTVKQKLGLSQALSPDQARQAARKYLTADDAGEQSADSSKSMSWLFDRFMEKYAKVRLRENTQRDYGYQIKKHLRPAFGSISVKDLRRSDVRKLFEARSEVAPVTANKMMVVLSSVMSYALSQDLVEYNVCLGIEPNPTKPRRIILSDADILDLATQLNEVEPVKRHYFWLLLLTAQRRSELVQMQWKQIEREALWVIPESVTKNGMRHTVPLAPLALEHLRCLRALNGKMDDAFFSWETKHNKPVAARYDGHSMTTFMREFRMRKMPKSTHFTLHDFRRTAATGITTILKDQVAVKRVLNHITNNPTNIYDLYAYDDVKLDALTKWEDRIRTIVPASVVRLSLRD